MPFSVLLFIDRLLMTMPTVARHDDAVCGHSGLFHSWPCRAFTADYGVCSPRTRWYRSPVWSRCRVVLPALLCLRHWHSRPVPTWHVLVTTDHWCRCACHYLITMRFWLRWYCSPFRRYLFPTATLHSGHRTLRCVAKRRLPHAFDDHIHRMPNDACRHYSATVYSVPFIYYQVQPHLSYLPCSNISALTYWVTMAFYYSIPYSVVSDAMTVPAIPRYEYSDADVFHY